MKQEENPTIGSTLDSFLKEEGLLQECDDLAIKKLHEIAEKIAREFRRPNRKIQVMKLKLLFESDKSLRDIERLAAQGDPDAIKRLDWARARAGQEHQWEWNSQDEWDKLLEDGQFIHNYDFEKNLSEILNLLDLSKEFVGNLAKTIYIRFQENRSNAIYQKELRERRNIDLVFQKWLNSIQNGEKLKMVISIPLRRERDDDYMDLPTLDPSDPSKELIDMGSSHLWGKIDKFAHAWIAPYDEKAYRVLYNAFKHLENINNENISSNTMIMRAIKPAMKADFLSTSEIKKFVKKMQPNAPKGFMELDVFGNRKKLETHRYEEDYEDFF